MSAIGEDEAQRRFIQGSRYICVDSVKLATATRATARSGDAAAENDKMRQLVPLSTTTQASQRRERRRGGVMSMGLSKFAVVFCSYAVWSCVLATETAGESFFLLVWSCHLCASPDLFFFQRFWYAIFWWVTYMIAAAAFPTDIGYACKSGKCVYDAGDFASSEYKDGLSCMKECGQSEIQSIDSTLSDTPDMTISSSLKGTCVNCSLVIQTTWNFPEMFDTYDLTPESLSSDSCNFTSTMEINSPPLWVLEDSVSNCFVGDDKVECTRDGNRTLVTLNASTLAALIEPESQYVFSVDHFSTRLGPGTKTENTVMNVKFDGTGCCATQDSASQRQVFNLALTSSSYKLIGMFTDTRMEASDRRVLSTTSVSMIFRSGAVLRAGAFILLRVAKDLEDDFSALITDVSDARMEYDGEQVALDLFVGKSNISFTIPDSFAGDINNGDTMNITFDNFKTPSNDSMTIEKCYLSAYQGLALAVDNSPILFYPVMKGTKICRCSCRAVLVCQC